MGVERLPLIVERLLEYGRDPSTPVAIVSNGTLPNQTVVTGTLEDIVSLATECVPPAAIIIGEVVRVREKALALAVQVVASAA